MALLETGVTAPDFSVPDQDGIPKTLEDYAGRYLVLW